MKYLFKAKIYKTGINWTVDVPQKITKKLKAEKGYIYIKGRINGFDFTKSLVPVKNCPYRLFVNAVMMKGGQTALGKTAAFEIEQGKKKDKKEFPMPKYLKEQLELNNLTKDFNNLTLHRKKKILSYLNYIKTEETLIRNVEKVVKQLKNNEKNVRVPLSSYN